MKVLVTGGAGFIGSHLAQALLLEGHEVTVLDNLSRGQREQVPEQAEFIEADVRSLDLKRILRQKRFDLVSHHAAISDTFQAARDPAMAYEVNVEGTLNLLECCRAYGWTRFILASSAAVYGPGQPGRPFTEEAPPNPSHPYAATKRAAERVALEARRWGIQPLILRYSNIYGIGNRGNVVAAFCEALVRGEPPRLFGGGEQVRDFLHISDLVRYHLWLIKHFDSAYKQLSGQRFAPCTLNVSSGEGTKVKEVWEALARAASLSPRKLEVPEPIVARPRGYDHDPQYVVLSPARLRMLTKLKPQVPLDLGLRLCLESYMSSAPTPS